jgi:hypothetical protein
MTQKTLFISTQHWTVKVKLCKYYGMYVLSLYTMEIRCLNIDTTYYISEGARRGVVGWGTTLQAKRQWIRFPMRSLDFFNWSNPSSLTMALGSTQPLTEMSTRNLKNGRCVRPTTSPPSLADCLENVGASTSHNTMDLCGLL